MRVSKKTIALVMAMVTVFALGICTLAYFTDRYEAETTATAGTLTLDGGITIANNAALLPGYGVQFTVDVANEGNKAADVLETLVLTVKDGEDNAKNLTAEKPEFAIYTSGVTLDGEGKATIAGDAVKVGNVSGNQITYSVPEFILNGGSGSNDETVDGILISEKSVTYTLVFNSTADNSFQALNLTLDYEAQAKQHSNTDAGTWGELQSTVSFAGNDAHMSVPAAQAVQQG